MNNNKNIAIIAGTLGQGGAERQLYYLTKSFKSLGYTPLVLTLSEGEYYENMLRDDGVEVIHIQSTGRIGRVREIVRILRSRLLYALMSMHFYTNLYAAAAGKLIGIDVIGSVRNDCYSEIRGVGALGKLSLTTPSLIAANSLLGLEHAVAAGRKRDTLYYLPNVVDTEYFSYKYSTERAAPITLVLAGRLEKQKRIDRFIRLIEKLSAEMDVAGHIYGSGTLEDELKMQAEEMGLLNTKVFLKGQSTDMREVYQSADLLILSSDHEGTPNVVLEAQSCGLPVIATGVGGIPNIIQHNLTGVIVPSDDEQQLFEETRALLRNPEKRVALSRQAREFIECEHSFGRLEHSVEELLRRYKREESPVL